MRGCAGREERSDELSWRNIRSASSLSYYVSLVLLTLQSRSHRRFAPPSGFGFDGSLEPGMVPRFDPALPPGVGPRGGQGRREDRIRGNHDAGKPPKLPDNNMFM